MVVGCHSGSFLKKKRLWLSQWKLLPGNQMPWTHHSSRARIQTMWVLDWALNAFAGWGLNTPLTLSVLKRVYTMNGEDGNLIQTQRSKISPNISLLHPVDPKEKQTGRELLTFSFWLTKEACLFCKVCKETSLQSNSFTLMWKGIR